jgi:hypothetical protein
MVSNSDIKLFYCFSILFFLAASLFGQEEKQYNPADITEAATNIQIMPEYNKSDEYTASGLRINLDRDWAEGKYSVNVEIAYGKADFTDGKSYSGFTDTRTRLFWKFYSNSESALANMVFNLDLFIPTGNADQDFGIGTWMFVPGVILAFPVTESFSIYANPRIQFTTGKTTARSSAFYPGRNPLTPRLESEEYIFAFELETFFVKEIGGGSWIWLAPLFNYDFIPEPGEDNYELTLRGQIGKMFGRYGLGIEGTTFLAGEKSQDYQLRMIVYYYF